MEHTIKDVIFHLIMTLFLSVISLYAMVGWLERGSVEGGICFAGIAAGCMGFVASNILEIIKWKKHEH